MKSRHLVVFTMFFAAGSLATAGQEGAKPQVVQAVLTEPGAAPFHLQAIITERADPNEHVDVEMFWASPDKWRRTIRSREFTQTLIVNRGKVFEQDSDNYIPVGIETLVTAMVDPRPILKAVRPEDRVRTKANGGADESGRVCFDQNNKMCMHTPPDHQNLLARLVTRCSSPLTRNSKARESRAHSFTRLTPVIACWLA